MLTSLYVTINKNKKECNAFQDSDMKRSPHLVPYNKVDDAIKKANRYVLNGICRI